MCSKIELSERQKEISKVLSAIGPEISQFYLDGLELIELNLGTKSYHENLI